MHIRDRSGFSGPDDEDRLWAGMHESRESGGDHRQQTNLHAPVKNEGTFFCTRWETRKVIQSAASSVGALRRAEVQPPARNGIAARYHKQDLARLQKKNSSGQPLRTREETYHRLQRRLSSWFNLPDGTAIKANTPT